MLHRGADSLHKLWCSIIIVVIRKISEHDADQMEEFL